MRKHFGLVAVVAVVAGALGVASSAQAGALSVTGFNDAWSQVTQQAAWNADGTVTMSKAFTAVVFDGTSYPSGVPVSFTCTGPGTCVLAANNVPTNPYGKALTNIYAVTKDGTYQVVATLPGGASTTFSLVVKPSTATISTVDDAWSQSSQQVQMSIGGGGTGVGYGTFTMPKQFTAFIYDNGIPLHVPVTFTCSGPGSCTLSATSATTNAYGKVGVVATSAMAPGQYQVEAKIPNGRVVDFSLSVKAPPPAPPGAPVKRDYR